MNASAAVSAAARRMTPMRALAISAGFIAGAAGTMGFAPLAVCAVAAAWLISMNGACFVLLGVLAGALASGSLASFSAAALFGGAQLIMALVKPARGTRALIRTCVCGVLAQAILIPFIYPVWGDGFVLGLCSLLISPAAAAVILRGARALSAFMDGRRLSRTDAATLGMLSALLVLALVISKPLSGITGLAAMLFSALGVCRSRAGSTAELMRTRKKLQSSADVARGIARYIDLSGDGNTLAARQLDGVCGAMEALASTDGTAPYRRFDVTSGSAAVAMKTSEVSGDSMILRREEGRFLAILSDGMGSGEAARRESANAALLFADMFSIGYGEAAKGCLNSLLMLSDEEMYATLDAVCLDLATGEAQIVKFGAPPTYILRDGKVRAVEAPALPAGIISCARAGECALTLRRGDALVMMTDGLSDALGMELIASVVELVGGANTPEDAAGALVARAVERGFADDMSAVVIRVDSAAA